MYLLKMANRNLKVLLSIGGWTYSQDGLNIRLPKFTPVSLNVLLAGHFAFVTNAASRATFVTNAVQFIENYGFDGM